MVAKKVDGGKQPVAIPLEWHVPEGQMTPLASNMVVQIVGGLFKLSFFEVKPPIQFDSSLPPPRSIRADMVASVFVMPNEMGKIIKLLQEHLDKYRAKKKRSSDTP